MIYVNDFKVGDTVVLRDGTFGTVEEISEYKKGFILELSCFPGGWFCCYADGWQKNFEQSKYDIVEHVPANSAAVDRNKDVRFRMFEVKREMQQLQFRINAIQRMIDEVIK